MVNEADSTEPQVGVPADGYQKHSAVEELTQAAKNVIAYVDAMSSRPGDDLPLAIATFAAHEATRKLEMHANPTVGKRYTAFLCLTAASPICVAALPKELHSSAWDMFGLLSTMLLLYLTYGLYTSRMLRQAFSKVGRMGANPSKRRPRRRHLAATSVRADGHDHDEAIVALSLLIVGTTIFILAIIVWCDLVNGANQLHEHITRYQRELVHEAYSTTVVRSPAIAVQQAAQLVSDHARYATSYCLYFVCVWILSGLFILMDFSVAAFNASHSETYVAASSAWFVTIPMCVGVSLVALYLLAEWFSAWVHGAGKPIADLPVEFASGALTFQMMLSNIVFVVMKRNFVFKTFYSSVETTWKP